MSAEQIGFVVFCVENVAAKLGIPGEEAYCLLTEACTLLDDYIIPNYEMLHTQGKDYIVNDIISYMKECGVFK
ncbi:MAG: DUF3791 domain-containing protein [Roseburia sp.]|nr:DUF3791 domain-containing protein [Roseburia sp.]MCM1277396.1 DUF3791 domain-containing protein [Robinsoniella sp.]